MTPITSKKDLAPQKFPHKGRAGYLRRLETAKVASSKLQVSSKKETGWGKVADWYHETVEDKASYQRDLILPNLLRLLDIKQGRRVLDLGCGEGLFTRRFAKAGAEVTAIDIAPELVMIAKREAANESEHYKFQPRFFVSDAAAIPVVVDATQDIVVINLALQNIEDVSRVFKECARVLKTGGKLFIVLNHPAFRIPKASGWGWTGDANHKSQITNRADEATVQFRRVDKYMSELRQKIDMTPSASAQGAASESTISFHRPLQYFVKLLGKAGLAVVNMEEWVSNKKSQEGPRAMAENVARNEIPLFMMLEVKKL